MTVTSYLVLPSTLIGRPGGCTWPEWGSLVAASSKKLTWKTGYTWKLLERSNSTAWLLIILLTWYLLVWQFSNFLLGRLINKFLVSNHTKSPILYWKAGPQYWLAWHSWSACFISMLSHKIFWIFSICVAKVSVLISLILLGGGSTGSKAMRGWNPLFTKKKDTFVGFDLVLLPVNSAKGSQSGQSSWK